MRLSCWLVLAALTVVSAPCAAALATTWERDFDEEKEWQEIQAQIPPYPKDQNLLLVETGSVSPHRFYVDAASISVGEDEVVRYTTVVKTAGGATNVSFEGMRCRTREQKLYALGHKDGTWARARDPKWQRIQRYTPHLWTLHREFFCPQPSRPTPPKQAIDALRRGVGLGQSSATDD